MSESLNLNHQEAHQNSPSKASSNEDSPQKERPQHQEQKMDESGRVDHAVVHQQNHGEYSKTKSENKSDVAREEQQRQADFDNFDQFNDVPDEHEEKSQNNDPLQEQHESAEGHQQIHHLQRQQVNQLEQKPADDNSIIQQKQQQKAEVNSSNNADNEVSSPINSQIKVSANNHEPSSPVKSNIQPLPQSQIKSTVIIRQAEKERISSTFTIFLKYNIEYQKTVSSYKLIIKNVRSQISNKQSAKREVQSSFLSYFETYIKINREFYERSSKIQREQTQLSTTNKLANIREELKLGFEGLFDIRKTLTDEMRKLQNYILTYTIKGLNEAFEVYRKHQNQEEKRQQNTIDLYEDAEKTFMKLFLSIEKLFKKGMSGDKSKEDLFIWIVKFINEEKQYRQFLVKYGKTVLDLKKTFVAAEKELFTSLQRIINQFKLQSRKVFAAKKEQFKSIEDYLVQIEEQASFAKLCTITDVDYIKSVLELQNRKEYIKLTDDHFIHYLDLPFFDRFVGNKKDLFKGAINKCFPLLQKNQELVHTISGNLVHFNKETDQCKDKFQIKNLNARLIAEGTIEFDQIIKGIVFNDNRTARFKLQNNDRAEELICYLNEKEEWGEKKK